MKKKIRLTTSEEIINRIKWDARYPHEQITIRYMDRFLGLMDTTLEAFDDADFVEKIPYHRIYYFLLNGKVVWDREKRKDLISSGRAMKYVKYSDHQKEWILPSSLNEKENKTSVSNNSDDQQNQDLIIFSDRKKRYYYRQYKPEDVVEDYMSRKNNRELALPKPTHISQKGGHYHMDITKYEQVLRMWARSVKQKDVFFMEEYRTSVFRLYLDFDFKTSTGKPFSMVDAGYLPIIQDFTIDFFKGKTKEKFHSILSAQVLVTESHGEWTDAATESANYKSGFRLYFPTIFVDENILKEFVMKLGQELEQQKGTYPGKPEDWQWTDIVDLEQVSHKRARMFGTVKWRRGNILGRKYSFQGFYDSAAQLNEKVTNVLRENLIPFLQLTSVRLDGKPEISNSKNITTLIVSDSHVRENVFPLADLRKSHMGKAGFLIVE